MITYYKNVFLLLTTVAVNVGCQYFLEEYAPTYGNYEPIKYSLPFEIDGSGDGSHKLRRRNSDDQILDLSKTEENIKLEKIIIGDAQTSSLYNRVRRDGVYGEKNLKIERKFPDVTNIDVKQPRSRYASRSSPNPKINPTQSKIENAPATNSSRNLSSRRRDPPSRSNSKRIVKKESYAEAHFLHPTQLGDIQYISDFNLNPVNIENIPFQSDDQKFLHQLSSIQPQQFMETKQFYQSTPRPYQYENEKQNQGGKLLINVPDEPQDYTQGKQEREKQIEQGFSYIHDQPHVKSQLENIQRFITPESPKIVQPPIYHQPQDQKRVLVYSNSHQPENQHNYQTQNVRLTAPIYQGEYASKPNPNEEESGVIPQDDGEIKYVNYGYRQPQQQQSNEYIQYNTQSNYQQFPANYFNTNNNYPQTNEAQISQNNKLSSQNHYPAILVHINGKTGLPFYPTSKNIFNIPYDAQFDYEGIPRVDPNQNKQEEHNYEPSNEDFRKEVYKSHYGYDDQEDEQPNAQRRLYTGLTFHASARNLYDGKTPSLRNPPPKNGDVIWQAGDPITDPQEILVRQLNETCAYIQFNETTPGDEDGTKPNIWQAGDYSAQQQEEELIRSVNITCENYTTDALSNFTSGYTIIDYCSQCVNAYEYDYNNQNQDSVEQNYNQYYQPSNEQYQYYSGSSTDPRLENGEIAGFYKRKRLAQDDNNKKQ